METGKKEGKKGILHAVLVALILAVAMMSGVTAYNYTSHTIQDQKQQTTNTMLANLGARLLTGVDVSLRLTVTNPDGQVVSTTNYPHDLITNNMIDFIGDFFGNSACANNLHGTGGSLTTACAWCSQNLASPFGAYYNVICFGNSSYPTACCGGSIGVGTGVTPAARGDYNLQTQVGSSVVVNQPTIVGNSIVIAAGITLTAGATVTEAAFFASTGDSVTYLIFHDVFAGIVVSADQTIQVQYTINFPSATNENFMSFVASWLEPVSLSRNNIGTFVTTGDAIHTTGTLLFWSTSVNGQSCNGFCPSIPIIEVGTSSTAPTSSDYALNAQVGPTNAPVTTTIDTTTNYRFMMENSITLTSPYTIQEAGVIVDGYLMLHLLTGPVTIPAGNAITTQFTVGF